LLLLFYFGILWWLSSWKLAKVSVAIQRRAGHASARTTSDIYGHVTEKLENSTVKQFNQFDPRNLAQKQS
ncbi:hypothetical protein ACWFOH_07655, partial [Bacillus subtilis]